MPESIKYPLSWRIGSFLGDMSNVLGQAQTRNRQLGDDIQTGSFNLLKLLELDEQRTRDREERIRAAKERERVRAEQLLGEERAAALERTRRGAIGKIGAVSPFGPLSDGGDPTAPNFFESLSRPPRRTLDEAMRAAGLNVEELSSLDDKALSPLARMFPGPRDRKTAVVQNADGSSVVVDVDTGRPVASGLSNKPEVVREPRAQTREETLIRAARAGLRREGISDPDDDAVALRAEQLRQEQAEGAAKAGNPSLMMPKSAEERRDFVKDQANLAQLSRIDEIVVRRPDLVGGPLGVRGIAGKVKERLDVADPEFTELRASLDVLRSTLINALAGAAIGPAEATNYLRAVPQLVGEGWLGIPWGGNSTQEFLANLQTTRRNIEELQALRTDLVHRGMLDTARAARVRREWDKAVDTPPGSPRSDIRVLPPAVEASKYLKKRGY